MSTLAAPAGYPAALAADVTDFQRVTDAIDAAAQALMDAMYDSTSQAVDALYERATRTKNRLEQAHGRYEGTTQALRDYQVALQSFHETANRAIDDENHASYRYRVADEAYDDAVHEWRLAAQGGQNPSAVEGWQHEAERAKYRRDAASDDVNEAWTLYRSAVAARDEAAQRALDRISASFDGTNDSWRDEVGAFIGSIADFFAAVAEWATEILKTVLEAIAIAIAAFVIAVIAIVVVLAVVAIALVLVAIVLVVALSVVVWLANLAQMLVMYLAALGLIAIAAYLVADGIGLSDQDTIRFVALVLGVACPPLGAFIVSRLLDEALKPTPVVTPYDPSDARPEMVDARNSLDKWTPRDAGDLMMGAALVDAAGGGLNNSDRTVVDIAEVRDPDGNITGYIVTPASTLDWVADSLVKHGIDPAAVNDLDADFLLMLAPEVKGQYERAILEAMEQADIPPGAPVLMTGFSLGGIMAAHMTDTGSGGYNYTGVVVAGSSIDQMHLADDMPVLQAKHTLDLVHESDFITFGDHTAMHQEVWDGPFSGVGVQGSNPIEAHNPILYAATIKAGDSDGKLSENFEAFLISADEKKAGWTVTHEQYEFAE